MNLLSGLLAWLIRLKRHQRRHQSRSNISTGVRAFTRFRNSRLDQVCKLKRDIRMCAENIQAALEEIIQPSQFPTREKHAWEKWNWQGHARDRPRHHSSTNNRRQQRHSRRRLLLQIRHRALCRFLPHSFLYIRHTGSPRPTMANILPRCAPHLL